MKTFYKYLYEDTSLDAATRYKEKGKHSLDIQTFHKEYEENRKRKFLRERKKFKKS